MKKALKRTENYGVYYFVDGEKIYGKPERIAGDISSGLYGDISGLSGDISELYGDISSGLYGNISSGLSGNIGGLYGDISGLSGNISDCDLSDEDRTNGVCINDLISK